MRCDRVCLIVPALALVLACGDGDDGPTGSSSTGSLQVTLVITGEDLDSDGCRFAVDAGTSRTVLPGESTTFTGLLPGSHVVQISGVAPNCQVQGNPLREATVIAGQTVAVTFAVICASTLGAIEVIAVTTGNDIDSDGYAVSVDGGPSTPIGTDGTITIGDLSEGTQTVALSGLAANCEVSNNPRTVTVSAQQTTSTTFQVECLRLLNDRIVFVNFDQGEIFAANPDGSNLEQITSLGIAIGSVSVSPDGTRIAVMADLSGNWDIAVVNSNGTGLVNLTQNPALDSDPDWSPDGTRIAFSSDRSGIGTVWTMDADGSNPVNVSGANGYEPAWSPDGSQIAFSSTRDGNVEVYVMNSDGSGQVNLTNNSARDVTPAWSPDGLWLAFTSERDGLADIMIMGAGGGGAANVTDSPGSMAEGATWSPDGSRVAFYSNLHDPGQFEWDIYTVLTNGTSRIRVTSGGGNLAPDWAPAP